METRRQSLDGINPTEAYITVIQNDFKKTYPIGHFFSIGRDPAASLSIPDPFVSNRHCKIEKTEKGFFVKDQRSKNGTSVNGTKVIEALLKDGDKISIGDIELLFSTMEPTNSLPPEFLSKNKVWSKQLERLPQIAASSLNVLITGPSGSGKEGLSRWIHFNSSRKMHPFISVNCSALTENLVESELFGHVRGSFTGATNDRKGAFVAARGGTLFLDEIGDLPLSLQPKLLRALENQEVKPVGSDQIYKTDVRMIAATHQNLDGLVNDGKFRSDLFYRLNVIRISPPCLTDRMEDFEDIFYRLSKDQRVRFSVGAINQLKKHDWPGNIRELKNLVLRAAALFGKKEVREENLPELIQVMPKSALHPLAPLPPGSPSFLKEIERELILKTLKENAGNQRRTATILGIPKSTLHDKIKTFGIDLDLL
jgi:DNA-binding NtrC family response regulator